MRFLPLALLAACATTAHPTDDRGAAASSVLDAFHAAAANADESGYLDLLAPDGVFLGTDATERWPKEEFRKFVHPYFSKGKGWTYLPHDRHIDVKGDFAWFDELLRNEHYGELRGSGALLRIDGAWKLVQYNLAFTIPNDKADKVVELLRPGNRR